MTDRLKVLLAEDNAEITSWLRMLVRYSGNMAIVGEATDGDEAVSKGMETEADVIVMDIMMPGKNGIEAVKELRSRGCTTPIVMLTVVDDHIKLAEALCAGANGYALKTAGNQKIVDTIFDVAVARRPLIVDAGLADRLIQVCQKHLEGN
jgi:DNA-binding NarL/FixJ family response regulator